MQLPGQGDGDIPAPRSEIQDALPAGRRESDDRINEGLRFGAGNEDAGGDPEGQGPEFFASGQIGHRPSGQTLPHKAAIRFRDSVRERELGIGIKTALIKSGGVKEQDSGIEQMIREPFQ